MHHNEKAQVDAACKNIPRFLFRCWTPLSGGDDRINTATVITSRGFLEGSLDSRRGFDNLYPANLDFLIQMHLGEDDFDAIRYVAANVFSTRSALTQCLWTSAIGS